MTVAISLPPLSLHLTYVHNNAPEDAIDVDDYDDYAAAASSSSFCAAADYNNDDDDTAVVVATTTHRI